MIGDATMPIATEIVDDTSTTIAAMTVIALRAEHQSDPTMNNTRSARKIATATISHLIESRRRQAEQRATAAPRARCTVTRTARRSTRGPIVRRTRPIKRSRYKRSKCTTPMTIVVRPAMDPATTTAARMRQARAKTRAVARSQAVTQATLMPAPIMPSASPLPPASGLS